MQTGFLGSLRRLWQYRWCSLRHPKRLDFVDMGLGIEARYERCGPGWAGHLAACKELEREFFASSPCASLLLLGAGRLFDVDLDSLGAGCRRVCFVDADPSVLPHWRRAARLLRGRVAVETRLEDITGSYDSFCQQLHVICGALGQREEGAADWLLRCALPAALPFLVEQDALWSLNIIGQLPIYFRDRLVSDLARACRVPEEKLLSGNERLRAALSGFESRLRAQHLAQLAASGARWILLLGDLRFSYYARNGATLEREEVLSSAPVIPGYRLLAGREWQWDIAPPDQDGAEYGIRHEVGGWRYERTE